MKIFYVFFSVVFFLVGIIISRAQNNVSPNPDKTKNAEDVFWKYELDRLRDPETGKIPDNIRQKELDYAATISTHNSSFTKGMQVDSANNLNWQSRGTWNIGGRTRAFAIDVTNTNKYLAGSTSGGMWTSVNGGVSWFQTWTDTNQSVSCITQDTRAGKTNIWYVGTGEGIGQSASAAGAYYLGKGMYKSTDGGQTWNSLDSTVSGTPQTFDNVWDIIWNVATNPADVVNDVVYAATYGAIMKSTDGGTSWAIVCGSSSSSPYPYFSDVAVTPTGIIYATLSSDGSQNGIWRSADGNTWTNITPSNFPATFGRVKIGISPSDENQIYFFASATTGFGNTDTNYLGQVEWNSLWKYYSDSAKWIDLSANLPATGTPFDKLSTQGGYDMVVKVHPIDTSIVYLGGTNLYRSTDGFKTSNNTTLIGGYRQGATLPVANNYLNHHPDQHEIVFVPSNPNTMISTNDGGIFQTTNNLASTVAWNPLNNGYLTSMFYSVAIDHVSSNDSTIIGGTQGNGSCFENSKNTNTTWIQPYNNDGSYCAIANNKLNYYFSMQNGKIIKTTLNSSGTVQTFTRIDPIGGTGYQFINPFILDPNNNNVMYLAGGKNLWRNDSLNIIPMIGNWNSISTGWTMFPDTVPTALATITALAVSKNPANILYYGTSNKNIYRINNANTGTDTAINITGSQFPNGANVSCIAIDATDARKVMAAFSNYNVYSIFYTSNADSTVPTWTKVAGNLEQNFDSIGSGNGPSVRWVSIIPVSNGTVYFAATSTGIYATDTLMGTTTLWAQQGASTIGNSICDMIDFRTTDGLVAVATHSHGIFTTNITSKSDVVSTHELQVASFNLRVYPNPSSGKFQMQLASSQKQDAIIKIYNVYGECIHRQIFKPTNQQIDLSSQPNGIYFLQLKNQEEIITKKIILNK